MFTGMTTLAVARVDLRKQGVCNVLQLDQVSFRLRKSYVLAAKERFMLSSTGGLMKSQRAQRLGVVAESASENI
jgi:hypothetical protein